MNAFTAFSPDVPNSVTASMFIASDTISPWNPSCSRSRPVTTGSTERRGARRLVERRHLDVRHHHRLRARGDAGPERRELDLIEPRADRAAPRAARDASRRRCRHVPGSV